MHRLVIFAALVGAAVVALPDVSEESDDVDTYFRAAGGALVKVDSDEDKEVKAFKYNYPQTYSVKDEEDSSEDEQFRFVAPSVLTYGTKQIPSHPVVGVGLKEEADSEESKEKIVTVPAHLAYSAVPSIEPVGFKPLFTGYKPSEWNIVSARAQALPTKPEEEDSKEDSVELVSTPAHIAYSPIPVSFKQVFTGYKPAQWNSVVATTKAVEPTADVAVASVAPVAEEYKAPVVKKVDTQVAVNPISINVPSAFSPLVYTAPTVTHVSAVPSTAAVTSFNSFYPANSAVTYTGNALTYSGNALTYSAPTFYASKPFFYAQKVNSAPYNYVVEKDN